MTTTHLAELRSLIGDDRLTAREVDAIEAAIRLADGVRHLRQACHYEVCGSCACCRACEELSAMEIEREEN